MRQSRAAEAAVNALTGAATRAKVIIQGYRDTVTIAPFAGAASSMIKVSVTEVW